MKEKPSYEEILKAKDRAIKELRELDKELWGLKDLGENLLLCSPNYENN